MNIKFTGKKSRKGFLMLVFRLALSLLVLPFPTVLFQAYPAQAKEAPAPAEVRHLAAAAGAGPLNDVPVRGPAFPGRERAIIFKLAAQLQTFTITASAGAGGAISPSGNVSVNSGASQTFTMTPSAGYIVSDVQVDGNLIGSVRTYAFASVTAAHTINATFMLAPIPPPDLNPLNQVPVPEPLNLVEFVKNKPAAIKLGKSLFWDMQVGSDGVQACGSCHFSAGADNRMKNTVNPGPDGTFQLVGPNGTLQSSNFPFHKRAEPADMQSSSVTRNVNDVVGSQGVRLTQFVDIVPGSAVDNMTPVSDPVFNVGGVNMRRVTGRNTPTTINAIFNFENFWDGRASFIFNGVNPFGPADKDAGVWFKDSGTLVKKPVAIQFASLASQSTGPPLDHTEMSARGRTFPKLGKKMLSLTPLGKQLVHPGDNVLGALSKAVVQPNGKVTGSNGLNTTYTQMIKDAFQDHLWDSAALTPDGFTQMEANFSLFWGLSIQLYVATLVSDQTPFDRWLGGDAAALTDQQKKGFTIFSGIGKCALCHGGIEFTGVSAANVAFLNNAKNDLIELMFVANGAQAIYDEGFNNTAVTPTTDDLGRGGNTPFTNSLTGQPIPLSFSRRAVLQAQNLLPFPAPLLDPVLPVTTPVNDKGLFKVPGLRNVELTAPYFHNGSVMTLDEVVDFYVRGGNFPAANIADLDPRVGDGLPLMQGKETMQMALVDFMKALTDPRVRNESAPFDHPEILVPNGDPEVFIRVPARSSSGAAAITSLTFDPVITPTRLDSQAISGAIEAGLVPTITVAAPATVSFVTVVSTSWSAQVSGLIQGANNITVSVTDSGVLSSLTATITVDITPPSIALNPVISPTRSSSQTVYGTVEAGATPVVTASASATAAPVVVTGAINWSSLLSNLVEGSNSFVVKATDAAGNITTLATATIVLDTIAPSLTLNPVASTTTLSSQAISGMVEAGAVVRVSVNSGLPALAAIATSAWSYTATLSPGSNTLSVSASDAAGNIKTLPTATISLVFLPPSQLTSILPEGWSLLSTPVRLNVNNDRLDQIFNAQSLANIEIAYSWSGGQWRQVSGSYELFPLEALYVKVAAGATATATFIPSPDLSGPPSRDLTVGLNLIGPAPSLELGAFPSRPADQALSSILQAPNGFRGYSTVISSGHSQPAWTYAPGAQAPNLLPFKGYWVIMDNPDTLFGSSTTPLAAQ